MQLEAGKLKIDPVLVFLFLSPIFYFLDFTKMDSLNPAIQFQQFQVFVYAAIVMIAVSITNQWVRSFLLLCVVHSAIQASHDPYSFLNMVPIAFAAAFYDVIRRKYRAKKEHIAIVFVMVLVLNLVFAFLQYFGLDEFVQQTNLQASGLMLLPCYLGQYAALTAPIVYSLNPWFVLLSIAAVLISKSTFCVAAMVASFLFLFWKQDKRKFVALLVIGLMGASVFALRDNHSGGQWGRRAHVWKMVFSKAMRSPFIGHGLGSYQKTLFLELSGKSGTNYYQVNIKPENGIPLEKLLVNECLKNGTDVSRLVSIHFQQPGAPFLNLKDILDEMRGQKNRTEGWVWNYPHNEILMLFYEFGILGVFIYVMFLVSIFNNSFNHFFHPEFLASIVSLIVISLVHFPFYLPCVALTFLVILGTETNYYK